MCKTNTILIILMLLIIIDDCFFLPCEDLGRMFGYSFPHLRFFFFFFFEVEISSRTLIPPSGQDQSTVAQRVKTTVAAYSLTSCV